MPCFERDEELIKSGDSKDLAAGGGAPAVLWSESPDIVAGAEGSRATGSLLTARPSGWTSAGALASLIQTFQIHDGLIQQGSFLPQSGKNLIQM